MSSEKVPTSGGAKPAVTFDVFIFFRRRLLGHIARIDAHGDDVELFADVKFEFAERAADAFHHHAAEHRTSVVHEIEQDRFAAVQLAEPDDPAAFVAKHQVEWKLRIEVLSNRDFAGELRRSGGVVGECGAG